MAQSEIDIPPGSFSTAELHRILNTNELVLEEELMDWVASKMGDRPQLYKIPDGRIIYYQMPYDYAVTFPSEESLRTAIGNAMKRSAQQSNMRAMIENPRDFLDALDFHINFLATSLNISKTELEISREGILNIQKAIGDYSTVEKDFIDIDDPSSIGSLLRYVGEVIYSQRKEDWKFVHQPWLGTYLPKDVEISEELNISFNWVREVIHELVENRFSPNLIGIVDYATNYKK